MLTVHENLQFKANAYWERMMEASTFQITYQSVEIDALILRERNRRIGDSFDDSFVSDMKN